MKLIIITYEDFFENECSYINTIFEYGLMNLHLRKPKPAKSELSQFIKRIDKKYHNRIILHDHFELLNDFNLKGVHLNRRNPFPPLRKDCSISQSCHSLNEITNLKNYDYAFLSPVFDSISKTGYNKAFTTDELLAAKQKGIINERIIALGGITIDNIPIVQSLGFGGIAVLGHLWGNIGIDNDMKKFTEHFIQLKTKCDSL